MSRNRVHPVTVRFPGNFWDINLPPTYSLCPTLSLPYFAAIVAQHQSCADRIGEGADLLVAVHQVEEGEDALARRGIGGHGEDDARCVRPILDGAGRRRECAPRASYRAIAQNGLGSFAKRHLPSDFP